MNPRARARTRRDNIVYVDFTPRDLVPPDHLELRAARRQLYGSLVLIAIMVVLLFLSVAVLASAMRPRGRVVEDDGHGKERATMPTTMPDCNHIPPYRGKPQ